MNENNVVLTKELILEQWSKTYNPNGKPDWSHIFPFYNESIYFKDSIQEIHGMNDFTAMCNRLTKRCKSLSMEISNIVVNENVVWMEWKMTMAFRKFPSTPMYGASRLLLGVDGRIIEQRDYYDLWGDIYNGIPGFRRVYRSFMKRFFG